MKNFGILFVILALGVLLFSVNVAYAEPENKTWIPENEIVSYFDSNGFYTVGGNLKNQDSFAIRPVVSVSVLDGTDIVTQTILHVPIPAFTDIPFKMKFPELQTSEPEIIDVILTFQKINLEKNSVEVIYDKTLKKHDDGHVTGNIINNGDTTVYYPIVFAIANGYNGALDIVQNLEYIEKIEPGEIVSFSMYPDPSITDEIFYYSCFAVTDSFVRPMYTERNDEKFYFRYDSGTWFTAPEFSSDGKKLSLRTQNSFPLETYANFEFPSVSMNEKFDVYVNGEPKEIIQSIDDRGNWHVAFTVEPRESGDVLITGFDENYDPTGLILIPDWIKVNAIWWAEGLAEQEVFVRGLDFMEKEKIIVNNNVDDFEQKEPVIPDWFKNTATWWAEDKIENTTFVNALQNLLDRGIVQF